MATTSNISGQSLIDVVIWTSVAGAFALVMARFAPLPQKITQLITATVNQETPVKALDIVINDLKQADTASFPFSSMTAGDTGWFRVQNPSTNQLLTYVDYFYQTKGVGMSVGSLRRCTSPTGSILDSDCSTVLDPIQDPASAGSPLFQQDSVFSNIIIVTVNYFPGWTTGAVAPAAIRTIRRASLRS